MLNFNDGVTKPRLIDTVILYNERTGDIHHVHTEIFYDGALELDKQTMERKAFELASYKIDKNSDQIGILHLRNYDFKRDIKYAVDVDTCSLIEKK